MSKQKKKKDSRCRTNNNKLGTDHTTKQSADPWPHVLGHHPPGRRNNDVMSSENKKTETGEKVRRYHSGKIEHTLSALALNSQDRDIVRGQAVLMTQKEHQLV